MEELVSIAMTTYNGERFLRKQLDSIYGQSYKKIEVIVGDDCSTDGTVKILDEYKQKYGLRYFINNTTLGFMRNFEKVLELCEGHIIALADQDDIWLLQKIERLLKTIGEHSLICSDADYIDEKGEIYSPSLRAFTGIPAFSGKPFKFLLFNNWISGCTILFKRELLRIALPIPKGEVWHDWWLALAACTLNGIGFLDESLVHYRKHENNAIGLQEKLSLPGKLFGFFINRIDRNLFKIQEQRLIALSEHAIFNNEEKLLFKTACRYYHDRLYSIVHWKAFLIAIRYGKYVFPGVSGFWRFKGVLGALLH
jgi:glycosyltransferase involved in cell wall biosynthesis